MASVKKWEVLSKFPISNFQFPMQAKDIEKLITLLLENRGLKEKKDIEEFLHGKLASVTPTRVGIDTKQLTRAVKRIEKAIKDKEQIVVFGDYDVDGITASAILWETLTALGGIAVPYIPHRVDEGYGLSTKGISNVKFQISNVKLIITVDNGIVANEAVDFASKEGIDVIITDHHTLGPKLPNAHAIVHTTSLCGAGVAWMLAEELRRVIPAQAGIQEDGSPIRSGMTRVPSDHLALVALATVADLVPLQKANRILLRYGLDVLKKTKRPGIEAICNEAQIQQSEIDVYTIGHVIGPRLNAMGRMESAMDSLRLLCTRDRMRAKVLADKLGSTNKDRQVITQELSKHAKSSIITSQSRLDRDQSSIKNILFVANDAYEEGVIGLIAGKLVEEFYRPAIVLSIGEKVSKASARSIAGFNIIDFIRSASHLLINAGGHPMAAGFTVETEKIKELQEFLEKEAMEQLDGGLFVRNLKIDCEIPLEVANQELFDSIQSLSPFGMANLEPVFSSRVVVKDIKTVGQEGKHLKLKISSPVILGKHEVLTPESDSGQARMTFDAIGFNLGDLKPRLAVGENVDIAYTISENVWNGRVSLQLKIKDLQFPQK